MEKNTTHVDQLRNKQFDNGTNNNRSSESNHDMGTGLSSSSSSGSGSTSGLSSSLSSGLSHAENSMEHVKDSAMNTFNDAKKSWSNIEQALLAKGQEAGKASRIYIYQNPFRSVLVAGAAGLIFGFLLSVMRK